MQLSRVFSFSAERGQCCSAVGRLVLVNSLKNIFLFIFFSAEESSVYGSHTAGSLTKKGRKKYCKTNE